MKWKLTVMPALVVLALSGVCLAGLGKPLPVRDSGKSAEALERAKSILAQKGYDSAQVNAAIEKLGPERVSLLGREVSQEKAGGYVLYFWDFLLFVLFVALIVWLIIYLIDVDRGYYYRPRRRY